MSSPVPPAKPRRARTTPAAHRNGSERTAGPAPQADPARPTVMFGPVGPRIGRIPVVDVSPVVEAGRWPAKAVVGEAVPVRATVYREGHDAVGATAVLVGPDGVDHAHARMVDIAPGLDRLEARLVPDAVSYTHLRA